MNHSLWQLTASVPRFAPLTGEIRVDVAVVGAGITGLTAAVLLAERGRSVAVVEKHGIAAGESSNTTAHITVAIDAGYLLERKYGAEETRLVADASRASFDKILELVDRYAIDCHLRRLPAYYYTENRKHVAELKREAAAARDAGIDARWVQEVPLPFATRGAVLWPDQAQFHPVEYLAALATHAAAAGVQIFERSPVHDVNDGEPCIVETPNERVLAKSVFMATNVPIAGFTHVFLESAPYRTYAMAFESKAEHPDGLFWDTADPYHYTRWQETREGTFLIAGGEDHRTGENDDTKAAFDRLAAYVREKFGEHPLRARWSGQVIEPHGGLALIGSSGNLYMSTGYSGQGMTFGTFGAMLVTDLITGVENRWKDLFSDSRILPHASVREVVSENLPFPKHLVADRVLSRDVEAKSTDEVPAGKGKIIEIDGKKIAAYRDDEGALHCVSPVCPHMKCDVAWNRAERTWDCPCHGSRFTPDGEVLNGPARVPLSPRTGRGSG